jgi:hypothetical protein
MIGILSCAKAVEVHSIAAIVIALDSVLVLSMIVNTFLINGSF